MALQPRKLSSKESKLGSQSGQIVVEYILLLIVAVGVAAIITNTMVSRSEDDTGFLILKWNEIIRTIGSDTIEE